MQKTLHFQTINTPNKNKNSILTYSQTQKSVEESIKTNIKYCQKFDRKITEQGKTLPIMYWLSEMHKTSIGARFWVVENPFTVVTN